MDEKINIIEKLKGRGGRIILILGLCGIALIFLSSLIPEKEKETVGSVVSETSDEYCRSLESKVSEIVGGITGSERVSVAITLDCGKQYGYADEGRTTESGGGNNREQNYAIVRSSDGGENGLLVTEYMPTVRGVAIVCAPVSKETEQRVCDAVMAALDISAKKIYVTQYAY